MEAKKEKIKVKVNVTPKYKEVEVEVSFPYYTRNKDLYCKFLSKEEAMWVCEYGFKRSIEHSKFGVPENWLAYEPTTEEEFNAKFNEVMAALINIKNEKTI